jgi:hypothetical protein
MTTRLEFAGPLAAKALEVELRGQGASFRTWITSTKRRGLRYVVEVFG